MASSSAELHVDDVHEADDSAERDTQVEDEPRSTDGRAEPPRPLGEADDARAEADPIAVGDRIARYVIRERLGAGGMGVVYAADDPELDRIVALKLLLSEHGPKAMARRMRLLREAQAMARLKHANVVGVLDVGVFDDRVFITMEYLEGARTVDEWIEEDHPSWEQILDVFIKAGEGLTAAHEAGLVHRDFKPGNVLVAADGHVRVTDFGLARPVGSPLSEVGTTYASSEAEGAMLTSLTKTGAAIGTPAYMAPEQHKREDVDQRSDQFSFCVALFECLYGLPPFEGDDQQALADAVTRGRVRQPPWDTEVKPHIWRAIRRGLIADPRERFNSLPELLEALKEDPGRTYRNVAAWSVAGVVVVAATVVLGSHLMPSDEECGDARGELAGVWDDTRRSDLAAVFRRIDTGYAPEAWARVEKGLDRYAEAWVASQHRACLSAREGTQPPEVIENRRACLLQRRRALAAVVDVVGTADAPSLTHAIGAVQRLPTLLPCDDAEAGTRMPEEDEAASGKRDAVENAIAKARALSDMGRYAESQSELELALADAEALEDEFLVTRAAFERGMLAVEQGDDELAKSRFEQAYFAAQRSGEAGLAVDAAASLAETVGVKLSDHEGGLEWTRHARAAMERLGPDPAREALVLRALSEIHFASQDYASARDHAAQGVALLERDDLDEPALLSALLNAQGNALTALGNDDEALAQFERVRGIRERLWGENHPRVGEALNNLGLLERRLGRLDLAAVHLHRAALVVERSLGPDHPAVAIPTMSLARVYGDQGEIDKALRYADRAVALSEAAHGRDDLATVLRRIERATLHVRLRGKRAKVVAELQACVRVLQSDYADHPMLSDALTTLAQAALMDGDTETTTEVAQQALRGLEQGGDAGKRAWLETMLARAEWEEWADGGDRNAAFTRMERAVEALGRAGTGWERQTAEGQRWLDRHRRAAEQGEAETGEVQDTEGDESGGETGGSTGQPTDEP